MRRPIACGHPHLIRLLLDTASGEAGSGGGGTTTQDPPKPRERLPLTEDQVRELIRQEGGTSGAPEKAFLKQDRRFRRLLKEATDRADQAERKLTEAAAKVPRDGSRVLDKDQAKAWDEFQALLKEGSIESVEALGRRLKAGDQAATKVAESERQAEIATIADILKVPEGRRATFARLAGDRKFLVEEEGEEGKKVRKAYVMDGDKKTPAEAAFKDDAEALGLGTQQQAGGRRVVSAPNLRPSANAPVPAQGAGGQGAYNGNPVAEPQARPLSWF